MTWEEIKKSDSATKQEASKRQILAILSGYKPNDIYATCSDGVWVRKYIPNTSPPDWKEWEKMEINNE